MIVQLLTVFKIIFLAEAARLKLPSKFADLVLDLNARAENAGLGPIAEAVRDGFNIEDATSVQEIKKMQELKSIDEIKHMKEIVSMQEIPDDVAEQFIEENDLVPISSLSEAEEGTSVESVEEYDDTDPAPPLPLRPLGGCQEYQDRILDVKSQIESLMDSTISRLGDILDNLEGVDVVIPDILSVEEPNGPMAEHEEVIDDVTDEVIDEPEINGDPIVNVQPIKNIQEIKTITPIKSIQEVVGIYALTDDQARRLKKMSTDL